MRPNSLIPVHGCDSTVCHRRIAMKLRLRAVFILAHLLSFHSTYGLVSYDNDTGRRFLIWALCIGSTNPEKCVEVEFYGQKMLAKFEADCTDLIFKGLCRVVVDVDDGYTLVGITFKSETGIVNFSTKNAALLNAQTLAAFGTYGKVQKDLLTAFGRLWDGGLGTYMENLWSNYCDLYISFSGYSMGSCLAQMAAVRFNQEKWWPAEQMFYFGYGTPRCGDEDFAYYMDQSVADKFRINWLNDDTPAYPATTCPGGSSAKLSSCTGYYHCCTTIHYTLYTTSLIFKYDTCPIPDTCKPPAITKSDHYSYFQTTSANVDSLTCTSTKTFPDV